MILPEGVSGAAFGLAADGNPRVDDAARRSLSEELGIPSEWAWVRQVHGARVIHATGAGIGEPADAVFTTDPAVPVAVSVADCLPVALIADGAAGMAHAGWRGAAEGVVRATIEAMTAAGHPPHTAAIGPGIGGCCFEVGPEVVAEFPGHESRTGWGTRSVDLPSAVATSLAGLRLVDAGSCTHHDDRFHSYRATGTDERQFGVAWVAPG